jgi:hypothetical protein
MYGKLNRKARNAPTDHSAIMRLSGKWLYISINNPRYTGR